MDICVRLSKFVIKGGHKGRYLSLQMIARGDGAYSVVIRAANVSKLEHMNIT